MMPARFDERDPLALHQESRYMTKHETAEERGLQIAIANGIEYMPTFSLTVVQTRSLDF